jgi:asparagine synthase (glutamine-hydrolysing)
MGFGVPLDHWFRQELRELTTDLLLSEKSRCRQFLRPESVQLLWKEHQERRFDHSARLWSLVMLESWLREWGTPTRSVSEGVA